MKIAYLNCSSGISGDMLLSALIDCGASLRTLNRQLAGLRIPGLRISFRRVQRGHIRAGQIRVHTARHTRFDTMAAVTHCLGRSRFAQNIVSRISAVFAALADAESRVHRAGKSRVHFHQLGEVDTIADIAGCALALDLLGIGKLYASAVVLGSGQVMADGGCLPVPAPAVLQLLRGRTMRIDPRLDQETVTPTGAALLSVLSEETSGVLPVRIERVGYGAGTRVITHLPNVLSVMVGQAAEDAGQTDEICLIEAAVDDMLPLAFQSVFETLLASGAVDVCTIPVMMKKQRPGVLLQVLTPPFALEKVLAALFRETTTLGARIQRVQRRVLERKILKLKSEYGIMVNIKVGISAGRIVTVSPEYEQCRAIARQRGLAFKTVYDRVKAQALQEVTFS